MNQDHTEIIIVLDRSGSMSRIKTDMEGGLNQFFEDQKKLPGKCTVTLAQFDDSYEVVYEGRDIKEVPEAKLVPRGNTALLDAVGRTISAVGERLAKMDEADRPGRVLFLIVTDGEENSSREYKSVDKIKQMIQHQTDKYSWCFVFLGANQDAFQSGGRIGIVRAQNFAATPHGVRGMTSDMSKGTESYRAGRGYKTP